MLHIIAVTAYALEEDYKNCIEAWTDDYYQRAGKYGRAF
jgi:CheY-like chemotaxis protein